MSEITRSARAGEFAIAGRPRAADNWDFILTKHLEGVPTSAIARMSGCSVENVRQIVGLKGQANPVREAYKPPAPVVEVAPAPVAPKPPAKLSKRGMPPKVRRIAAAVARKYGVSIGALIAKYDRKGLADARHEAWYLVRFYTDASLPMVGAWFDRDHTTIMNGIRRHEERLLNDTDLTAWNALGLPIEARAA